MEEGKEEKSKSKSISSFRIGSVETLFYIPDFICLEDQASLLNNINSAPLSKWKSLKNRRLQNWGGVVHEKGLLPQQLPPWLMKVSEKICEESGLFPAPINHVLINEYLHNQGIMGHQDGPAYFPTVAILSLGSPVVMDFTPHSRFSSSTEHQSFSVLLMPRSLLIFKDAAYLDFLHSIKDTDLHCLNEVVNEVEALETQPQLNAEFSGDVKCIRRTTPRVSLTFRTVLKVHKNLFKF